MRITGINTNHYQRQFISVEVEPSEKCTTVPMISLTSYNFFSVDLSGRTHEIIVQKNRFSPFDCSGPYYGERWNLGAGNSSACGWTLGLDLETALNGARAFCAVVESHELIAGVYLNIDSDWEAYSADSSLMVSNWKIKTNKK